jgi:hypothetical protein
LETEKVKRALLAEPHFIQISSILACTGVHSTSAPTPRETWKPQQ